MCQRDDLQVVIVTPVDEKEGEMTKWETAH
jgi:hypothetical protein